ncbi:MAG: PQQ-dependent sugar dehydrogenase [Armatimonadota bacterium]|nr:PQQ-dependent sugar dehydrogenase [Armatimonadota bacterium]MDR7404452.1 PQQ-dependent sugar dehydrogenase [Armatimonadota bacterium]
MRIALAAAATLLALATAGRTAPAPAVEVVVSGLQIPWAVAFAPDGRFFVTERPGRIRVVRDGRLDPQPWAVLEVAHVGEGGLLGLALAPEFARSGALYVYHTYRDDGRLWNRVVRLVERDGRGQVDRVILDRIPGAVVHDGGRILFGPDGRLYVTTGDARQPALAQDRASLAGKILRINPDGSVPADNPFPGSPVYSLGHRNPQGLAWHPQTRTMYAAEHGPSGDLGLCCRDEVNVIEAGGNYGWPEVSGRGGEPRFTDPIADSGPTDTWAPSGIAVPARGPWADSLLVAALRGEHLRRLILSGPRFARVTGQEVYFRGELGRLRDVAEGPDGALYLLTNNTDGRGRPRPGDDRLLRVVFR